MNLRNAPAVGDEPVKVTRRIRRRRENPRLLGVLLTSKGASLWSTPASTQSTPSLWLSARRPQNRHGPEDSAGFFIGTDGVARRGPCPVSAAARPHHITKLFSERGNLMNATWIPRPLRAAGRGTARRTLLFSLRQ